MAEAGHAAAEVDNTRENKYKQIMGIRTVHRLSFFALIYVGVEVTLGGKAVIALFKLTILIVNLNYRLDCHLYRAEARR